MPEDSGILNQKFARLFFSPSGNICDWGNIIWFSSIPLLNPWFHGNSFTIGCLLIFTLSIDRWFYAPCALYVNLMRSLFLISFLNALMVCMFGLGSNMFSLECLFLLLQTLYLLLSLPGALLRNILDLLLFCFSIWMIWMRRNYSKFQQEINTHFAIDSIKSYIRMLDKSSNKYMYNDVYDSLS